MAIKYLLSPTERDLAESLGDEATNSSEPEERGADLLIFSEHGVFGMQRKHVPSDLILSVEDGRLTRELALMKEKCDFNRLIWEGEPEYWFDGTITLGWHIIKGKRSRIPSHYTKEHLLGIMNDVELVHHTIIRQTKDLEDTVRYIKSTYNFLHKTNHTGLFRRPSAKGKWNVPSSKDIHLWTLQSFPNIGPTMADNIIKHFGRVPLKWTCTAEELAEISRISVKQANKLIRYLDESAEEYRPITVEEKTVSESPESEQNKPVKYDFSSIREKLKGLHS